MRDDRPERERYQRESWLDQVRDELINLWHQPKVLLVVGIIVIGWLVLKVLEPPVVQLEGLAVGDCIYVPTTAAGQVNETRPAGAAGDVISGLYRAGAERAPCDASHGHEVAGVFVLSDPAGATYPGATALKTREQPFCEAAFQAYVGRPSAGSVFELLVAVPSSDDWTAGRRAGVCLVGNADGTFMSGRAGGSGR